MFQVFFSVFWASYVLDMFLIFASKQTSCQDQAFILIDTAVIVTNYISSSTIFEYFHFLLRYISIVLLLYCILKIYLYSLKYELQVYREYLKPYEAFVWLFPPWIEVNKSESKLIMNVTFIDFWGKCYNIDFNQHLIFIVGIWTFWIGISDITYWRNVCEADEGNDITNVMNHQNMITSDCGQMWSLLDLLW